MPPHERLYRHALESIFACLSFSELAHALCVSRAWMAAVCSMPGIKNGKELTYRPYNKSGIQIEKDANTLENPHSYFDTRLASRMACHVSFLWAHKFRIPMVHLQRLATSTPFLRRLVLSNAKDIEWSDALHLPVSLQCIALHFPLSTTSADKFNAVIRYLATALPRLINLTLLKSSDAVMQHISLHPLGQLTQLKQLKLRRFYCSNISPLRLTPVQVSEVRALAQLEQFDCNVDEQTMLQLLEPLDNGNYLHWTHLPPHSALTDAVGAKFGALPHVRSFDTSHHAHNLLLTSFNALARLPALARITTIHVLRDNLLASLSEPLLHLTRLDLIECGLENSQLMMLMSHLPVLHTLAIQPVASFGTLAFLHPVRASLRKLHLCYPQLNICSPATVHELSAFVLTHLVIHEQSSVTDIPARLADLCVPSSLLPTLQAFRFTTAPNSWECCTSE
jgi:hypothetical protein